MQLAYKFYKRALDRECKEATFKVAYFYQHGIETEKNIQIAIRKYEDAAIHVSHFFILILLRAMIMQ